MSTTDGIEEETGDLFQAPDGSALMHACSARGAWGKGIALQFRKKYPGAYEKYRSHCMEARIANQRHDIPGRYGNSKGRKVSVTLPVGTALLIAPWEARGKRKTEEGHWVICLFTSYDYGYRTDSRNAILNNTAAALDDLRQQLEAIPRLRGVVIPPHVYTCRLNSGLFDVPWEVTKPLLEQAHLPQSISVIHMPDPEESIGRNQREGNETARQQRIEKYWGKSRK